MTEERRQTPTERNHELLKLALERPAPASTTPDFKVEQVKAVGGATVYEWAVHIPVCDEYPTADEAFQASVDYAQKYVEAFPAPANGNGTEQYQAEVRRLKEEKKKP